MSSAHETAAAASDVRRCPLHDIDPLSPEVNQEPWAYFERLRNEAPVYRDPKYGFVHVSRYEDIVKINRQPQIFSNQFGGPGSENLGIELLPIEQELQKADAAKTPTLLTCDPPAHLRYKRLAIKGFAYRRVEQLSAYMAEVIDELIDGFVDDGRCEFKSAFADDLPSIVIADMIGVDRAMLPQWHIWLRNAVQRFDLARMTIAERERGATLAMELNDFMRGQIERKRRQPGDDVISDLIQATLSAEEGGGRPLDDDELMSMFAQFFVAGQETSANTLTAGMYHLITNPDQMEMARARPELLPGLVEEVLRILTPVQNMFRRVTQDTMFEGVALKAGDLVMVKYGSGNHDERRFPDPERFDITREGARDHLAFGAGIHYCLGAELARKELTLGFGALLRRLKNIRLAEGAPPIRYTPNHILRGVAELPIEFERA